MPGRRKTLSLAEVEVYSDGRNIALQGKATQKNTANGGGAYGYGAVFELVNASGTYTETVLYSFGGDATDGTYPVGGLQMDSAGNLYGTTSLDRGPYACGLASCGTVFELVKLPMVIPNACCTNSLAPMEQIRKRG